MHDIHRRTNGHLWDPKFSFYSINDISELQEYSFFPNVEKRSNFILQPQFMYNKKCDVHLYTSHFLIIVFIYSIIFHEIRKIIS